MSRISLYCLHGNNNEVRKSNIRQYWERLFPIYSLSYKGRWQVPRVTVLPIRADFRRPFVIFSLDLSPHFRRPFVIDRNGDKKKSIRLYR